MMDGDSLPTEKQRQMPCELMYVAFVELRLLGWRGHAAATADLADAFHNLPMEMYGSGHFDWGLLRGMLGEYERKWKGKLPGCHVRNYVHMLDEIIHAT